MVHRGLGNGRWLALVAVLLMTASAGAEPTGSDAAGVDDAVPGQQQWLGRFGVRLTTVAGTRKVQTFQAGVPVPVSFAEQSLEQVSMETTRGRARVRSLGDTAAWLVLVTDPLPGATTAEAVITYRVTTRPIPPPTADVRTLTRGPATTSSTLRRYLRPTPGIESNDKTIKELSESLAAEAANDWEALRAYYRFAAREIEYRMGPYSSAVTALQTRVGDCEEKASVFIALARARGIPARTVWQKDHCWAEFCLFDPDGQPHWIPAHPSGPFWFGQLPMAPVILAKGDSFDIPGSNLSTRRTLDSWYRGTQPTPQVEFIHEITPAPRP